MGTFYIDKPELSYIHVPRTGMAMKKIISDWLKTNFTVIDNEDWMIDHPNLQMVRKHILTGKTISIVRNPWQRVYSLYRKVSTEGYWLDWNGKTLLDLKPINEWVIDYCNPDLPFEFPRWFNKSTNQIDFLNYDGNWVDFIIKAEELAIGFKPVQEYLVCNKPLPNLAGYDHWEFRNYFNDSSIKHIARVHERDIDFFKYSIS
jgi:hypothetical protein